MTFPTLLLTGATGFLGRRLAADMCFPAPRPRDCSMDFSRLAAAVGLAPLTLAEGFAAMRRPR